MRDLNSNVMVVAAINPAVRTADATGAEIDLQGFGSAMAVVSTGAIVSAGNFTPKFRECDTSGGTYSDVAAADLIGTWPTALAANSVYQVGYRGNKRFIRVVVTYNSGTSLIFGANVTKGHPERAPTA